MTQTVKNIFGVIVLLATCLSFAAVCLVVFLGFAVMVGG